jgi:hypothetical protein
MSWRVLQHAEPQPSRHPGHQAESGTSQPVIQQLVELDYIVANSFQELVQLNLSYCINLCIFSRNEKKLAYKYMYN